MKIKKQVEEQIFSLYSKGLTPKILLINNDDYKEFIKDMTYLTGFRTKECVSTIMIKHYKWMDFDIKVIIDNTIENIEVYGN